MSQQQHDQTKLHLVTSLHLSYSFGLHYSLSLTVSLHPIFAFPAAISFAAKAVVIVNMVLLLFSSSNTSVGHPVTKKSGPITDFFSEIWYLFPYLISIFQLV